MIENNTTYLRNIGEENEKNNKRYRCCGKAGFG